MRIVNKFKYKNKFFRAGELTVGDYLISLEDFDYFLEKVLLEFNSNPPKFEPEYLRAFLQILFGSKGSDLFKSEREKTNNDFHIMVGIVMRNLGQGYLDICSMPLRLFNGMIEDIECILDPTKYDPNRNDTAPDREKMREVFGSTNTTIT